MTTTHQFQSWGLRSASFWMVIPVAIGISIIGIAFLLNPQANAAGYGIPLANASDFAYGRIKGIRDIFSGLAVLLLLFLRMKTAVAIVFTAAIIIPVTDCLLILSTNGTGDIQHLLLHGLTALYMAVTSILLFRQPIKPTLI